MDSIVEGVDQFIEGLAEYAISIIAVLGMIIIFFTTPVWILPYKVIREKQKQRQSCHFPICEEREGRND